MGPGDDPFGHHEEVPHFDRQSHQRTQRREDERRSQRSYYRSRRAVDDENIEFEPQMSIGAHFMVVLGILVTSFAVPALYLRFARSNRRTKRDGSG
jgi:mannosyl-oligosaccharide alpha-1,2-mannosidase